MNTVPKLPADYTYHPPAQQHAYGPALRIGPEASDTGHEQFERTCLRPDCGVTRITIIGAVNPRAWRKVGEATLILREPACCEAVAANEVAA